MAKLYKTPAQVRRTRIRWGIAVAALLVLAIGALAKGWRAQQARAVVTEHQSAIATITKLEHKQVTYRLKRRTHHQDVYNLEYDFQTAGKKQHKILLLDAAEYAALTGQTQLEVWFPTNRPADSAPAAHWSALAVQTSLILNAFGLAVFVIPSAFVLQLILVFLFAREPATAVPEGFVTETSWLDVADHKLVLIDGDQLVLATFNSKHTQQVQTLYQENAALAHILHSGKGSEARIPIDAITAIETRHYSDTCTLTYGDDAKTATADFLTPAVKEHALARITARLPLQRSQEQLSRSRAAIPSSTGLALCACLAWFLQENAGLMAVAGLGAAFALKVLVTRLGDPPLITRWMRITKQPSLQPSAAT